MELQYMRQLLMESAVRVVAREGMEKTTTKAIAAEAKLNEAYIYKCFAGKDELLREALCAEDKRLVDLLVQTLPVLKMPEFSVKERAFLLWKKSWDFILSVPDDCIFYIRYYYSASCRVFSYEKHLNCYRPIVDAARRIFKSNTNLTMLLHQIFSTMLFFAYRVMEREMEQNEKTASWVFEQIYSFVVPNIREELLEEGTKEEI